MPAVKTKRISTLIESQLPEFISTEYELFSKFVQKYYEGQEVQGGPLDVLSNIQKYADIDYYEKSLLKQSDSLVSNISDSDTTINLVNAESFPEKNGYVRINDEIIFYESRTGTQLQNCSRGVSGNTKLGDLYSSSNFTSTSASSHFAGTEVFNISNLFLYAFVKNFENQYLGSFPEKYLKGEVDKRTLIKNIQKFYKAKGTDSSIKFIFNTIVATDVENKPEVYHPREFTYKSSESDWINVYALKVKIVSGDPKDLIGKQIVQTPSEEYGYASATVDNVIAQGTIDNEVIWNIVVAPETINGIFGISTKAKLEKAFTSTLGVGDRINVSSTIGWDSTGEILIGEEVIKFDDKTVTQFIVSERNSSASHSLGDFVYKPVTIEGSGVKLLTLGIVYDALPDDTQPYSFTGDAVQVSNPGFQSADPRIVLTGTNQLRWIKDTGTSVTSSTNTNVEQSLDGVSNNVSAIFADDQYYYITSSSYPSYNIFDGPVITQSVQDQKILRILRKTPTVTTEVYETSKRDVGILLNGVPIYGYKDQDSIRFGKLDTIRVDDRGRGYVNPPFVIVDGLPGRARAQMVGQVVDSIIIDTTITFPVTPTVEITSGRDAVAKAIVTGGEVTSIVVENPGKFYSSPPIVRITDKLGKGRFAEYTAVIDTDGSITSFEKIAGGTLYTQQNIMVDIIPVGAGAAVTPFLKEWNKNRFSKLSTVIDKQFGYVFENINNVLEYGYGQIANPKALRVQLNDNLNSADTEPAVKTHSPILGFAYDGNPIYGPFSYENPLDVSSSIVRMTSSYSLVGNRQDGPPTTKYPLGSFVNDYVYTHKSGSLDENNGRFCITPDFPEGTYAYFITIDSNQVPQFPYVVGKNYYSLPVDSNYNSNINQNDIPKNAKRFFSAGMLGNGDGLVATISEVKSGTVDKIAVDGSSNNFSVNCQLYFDNQGTQGKDASALVSSVTGKPVNYLQSKEDKVVKLTTIQNAFLFVDDTLRQPSSAASGTIVGTVQNDNVIVLKDVVGTFDNTGTFSADIKTFILTIDQDSSYTKGATLSLTDGVNPPIATAEILEGTSRQNTVTIKVLTGTWIIDDDYYIQSDNLFNTSGSKIITLVSLSDNLEPFEVNQSVALIETTENHGLAIGDTVDISIFPDDVTKTKNYYLRKRLYQQVTFKAPSNTSTINFDGIGRFTILNGGADYTEDVYTDVPLTGGTGSGAKATISVSSIGVVNNIVLTDPGTGYRRGDYLGVDDDQLQRSGASLSSSRLALYIDHSGISFDASEIKVKTAKGFAEGDLVSIGSEIVEITAINDTVLTVTRGKEGTVAVDHYNGGSLSLYKPKYNFSNNFKITNTNGSGYIQSYDLDTQTAVIVFDYSIGKRESEPLTLSSVFFDESSQERLVSVVSAGNIDFKFEFSEDNSTFTPNPNIEIQEFYKYTFDTSHSSLTGTYFDMSPSKSFNLLTLEKVATTILPGNSGASTSVKFGFGPRLTQNLYDNKEGTNFSNFYYFDKNGIVNSEGAFFEIITDPLQGTKTLNYVTPNRFVYNITKTPLWDGSGSISYTTSGQFAVGEINDINITNLGQNYKKVPLVIGCDPSEPFRGSATVLFDTATNIITGIDIDNIGSNYVNPKVVIVDGDGTGAQFTATQRNGELFSIIVDNPGFGYTYAPQIKIIESAVSLYSESNSIGIPQSVRIINNGAGYHLDKTVASDVTSKYTLALKSFSGQYQKGELLTQSINGVEVSRAVVSEYRNGSNLLKIEKVTGIIRENVAIIGYISGASGVVKKAYITTFNTTTASTYDNLGFYTSDKGRLGVSNQKLTDSFFYQDYSYVVKSKTSIEQWRDLIKSTTHPAGFKLFGQVDVETSANSEMPSVIKKADSFSIIQLWNPEKNKITVESTKQVTTQTIQSIENTRIRDGQGSAATSEFNFNETRAFEFTLSAPFDGYFDTDGRLQGTTVFQVLDNTGSPFTPISAESLIVTLDGILQEPGVAYTVSGDTIVFSAPPLGSGTKLTGNSLTDVSPYNGTKFVGRHFYFKDNQYNTRYIKKLRNIFQRGGTWIDAANQIDRNRQFIIEESIGYGKQYYSSLDWSTKLDDYTLDIGYILDAYQHDLRFGGNSKVIDYANIFANGSKYITDNKTESLSIFRYATNLANLAIINWDYVEQSVVFFQGSTEVRVADTDRIAIGMTISAGKAFSPNTIVVSIDSKTKLTLSKPALANAGGGGGASAGVTYLNGTTSGNEVLPSSTGAVLPGNQYSVNPGDTVQVPTSFASTDSATFYFSGINNGTYYDASNLINNNKAYLQEEVSEFVYANYALPSSDKAKCARDIGILVDNVVYHLRFGGNAKLVEFAQLYYTNRGYPYGEELTYLNGLEITAANAAWDRLKDLMVLAMRNTLGTGTYTNINPYTDNTVFTDTDFPVCAEVESSIDTMISIVKDIIAKGTGVVEVVNINPNKSGYWSATLTYSNYNILPDPLIPDSECADVISSVNSLYNNLDDILNELEVARALPDYIDGETKEFELYWQDGSSVVTEPDENFLLSLNAVLQETKYNASYPGDDSYYIDRTVVPNKLVFDVAPIWDQYAGARTLGEPTAVEKVVGTGVGNYKRMTLDKNLINNVRTGPFLILDLEDLTVANIEEPAYFLVFIDGVLQKSGESYTVSGPNIFFNFPITEQMNVDMRYLYGRNVGQILNLYDFNVDNYYANGTVSLQTTFGIPEFLSRNWMGIRRGDRIQAYQYGNSTTYNVIGEVYDISSNGNTLNFRIFGNKCEIIQGRDVYFAVVGRYESVYTIVGLDSSGSSITYETDADNRILVRGSETWRGTLLRKTYKNPFINLSNNTLIKVDGEDSFRRVKELPSDLVAKEQRPQEQLSNNFFGQVEVEAYNGVTRGEGLSIVATIENGSVVKLDWNKRSYDPITQPTAYQYYTPPVINFIPENGEGGGARAAVIVSKGQVISVELISGGSGYTKAPKVVVARRYKIFKETDIGVSLINASINIKESVGVTVVSEISVLGNQIEGINTFTSVLFDSPVDSDRDIISIVQTGELNVVDGNSTMPVGTDQPDGAQIVYIEPEPVEIEGEGGALRIQDNQTILSVKINSILTTNSISTVSREITSGINPDVIQNTALSNINYYQVGAFLDAPLDAGDTIIYVGNTDKFSTNGYLLIGTEIVRYLRKINDRFLSVQRGQKNTTDQNWNAGTFLRQIPDPVSIAYAGVAVVESESQLVTVKGGAAVGITQRETEYQIEVQDLSPRKDKLEFLRIPPPSGVIDGYQESVLINDPVQTRLNGLVDLLDDYGVVQRDGTIIYARNQVFQNSVFYIGDYTTTNAGHTISHFDGIFDDGACNVSAMTLAELETYFPALGIRDFELRKDSTFTLAGDKLTLTPPSIQNPVSISAGSQSISVGTVNVQKTTFFPSEGHLFTSDGTLIKYTSKTSTSFEGCTVVSGPANITLNAEIVPFIK
tara:strand:- start:33579 stop:43895 length:10317 start_codon:yes stop_codon:yes gene_type:complete